ncbi:hypothetical protein BKA70DRAFT_1467129 [Coprinopsis sp. MPI-PUGE-AT-0042]|nr:hypothetical protein BKA70DRAFT_1467129 [Coprinopsis sp. MPI-PUGE-AT-0042]
MLLYPRVSAVGQGLRFLRGQLRCISKGTRLQLRPICFPESHDGLPTLTVPDISLLPRSVSICQFPPVEVADKIFVSKKALAIGRRRLAQVYRGSIKSCGPADEETSDPRLNDVVLKIYDGSWFPTGEEIFRSGDYGTHSAIRLRDNRSTVFVPHYLAWQEAWVYHKLQSSRVSGVPQFLGAYELDLGNGKVFAIALSYIEGISFPEWLGQINSDMAARIITEEERKQKKFQAARAISAIYWQICKRGIRILDEFDGNNVKITFSPSGPTHSDRKHTQPKARFQPEYEMDGEILDELYFEAIIKGQRKHSWMNGGLWWKRDSDFGSKEDKENILKECPRRTREEVKRLGFDCAEDYKGLCGSIKAISKIPMPLLLKKRDLARSLARPFQICASRRRRKVGSSWLPKVAIQGTKGKQWPLGANLPYKEAGKKGPSRIAILRTFRSTNAFSISACSETLVTSGGLSGVWEASCSIWLVI